MIQLVLEYLTQSSPVARNAGSRSRIFIAPGKVNPTCTNLCIFAGATFDKCGICADGRGLIYDDGLVLSRYLMLMPFEPFCIAEHRHVRMLMCKNVRASKIGKVDQNNSSICH